MGNNKGRTMLTQHELNELIREIWPDNVPHQEPTETEGERIARLAYEAQLKRKQYEAEEKRYLEVLKTMACGETAEFGIYMFAKTKRQGNINYKAIPQLLDIDLEPYRAPDISIWHLSKKD